MAAPLVPSDAAITHLRLATPLTPEAQADLDLKLGQASDAIVDYLKDRADPTWDATTTPLIVQAAILLYLTNLWEHRGDDGATNDADAACWLAIERLLRRSRDPALA
jgi:hypothetical protein